MNPRLGNACRRAVVLALALVLLVLGGCVSTRTENAQWWDTAGNQAPGPGESLAHVGIVLATAAAIVALGIAWLWLESLDTEDD